MSMWRQSRTFIREPDSLFGKQSCAGCTAVRSLSSSVQHFATKHSSGVQIGPLDAAQVRWAKQSLEKLRVGSWRGGSVAVGGGALAAAPALALQREMLHTVAALHQFVCDRVVQSASQELVKVGRLVASASAHYAKSPIEMPSGRNLMDHAKLKPAGR